MLTATTEQATEPDSSTGHTTNTGTVTHTSTHSVTELLSEYTTALNVIASITDVVTTSEMNIEVQTLTTNTQSPEQLTTTAEVATSSEYITVPDTTAPGTTAPDTTVPSTTVPDTTVPSTTVPATTEPATTEPATTEPDTTEPDTHISTLEMMLIATEAPCVKKCKKANKGKGKGKNKGISRKKRSVIAKKALVKPITFAMSKGRTLVSSA